MFKRLLVTASVCLLVVSLSQAERFEVKAVRGDFSSRVSESTPDRTVITFEVGAYDRTPVDINGETFYQISYEEGSNLLIEGEPSLPRICRSIIIPDEAEVEINVLSSEYVDIPETPVAPSKGNIYRQTDPASIAYVQGPIYNTSVWYPSELASLRRPFIMRDFRGTVIEISAFQYNPAAKTLRVYTSVTVEVVTVGISTVNIIKQRRPVTHIIPEFRQIYNRRFLNYDAYANVEALPPLSSTAERYSAVGEAGDMLIITYDAFHNAVLPLAAWKTQKGIRTTVIDVSTIGNDWAFIKAYIQDFYDSPDNNLGWVLLVGDAAEVVPPYNWGGASDPSYSKLAGDDDYPDIFVGRFSAQSVADVETQVTRTIDYEKNPSGTDWFHKACGIASDQGDGIGHDGGEIDYEHMALIRLDLLDFTYDEVDAIYDPGASNYVVSTALNEGRSFVNYAGHGSSTSWTTSNFGTYHVNNLVNDNELPLVISVGCVNGNFTYSVPCFAETWMRATHNGVATGAIAAYMSSINQSWAPPMDAQDEAVDLLVAREKTSVGGICFNGSCKMIDLNGEAGVEMFDTWHIFGDPSVLLWSDTPAPLTVYHNSAILEGQTTFDVEVVGQSGALCALSGDGILYGSAYTDISGLVEISLGQPVPEGSIVTLTITAFNGQPYIVDLDVIAATGALVVYDEYSINDFSGNNDSMADAGETIVLGVQLKNIGAGGSSGVEATLSSADPLITVNDSYEVFGDISGGNGISFIADAFEFNIDGTSPDNHFVSFHLEINDASRAVWTSDFAVPVHRPNLGIVSVTVNDAAGNGNDVLDPGETAEVVVVIGNTGSGLASSVSGALSETDPFATVVDASGTFGNLIAGGSSDNVSDVFLVSADPACVAGYPVTFDLNLLDINGYAVTVNFELIIGDREVFYSDDFSVNKGWTGLGGDAEWTIGPVNGGAGADIYGNMDPEFDTSPSEDNSVLGNNLNPTPGGDYNSQIGVTCWVVSPFFDCTDYIGVQLVFNRWLGVEEVPYDRGFIEAFDGADWIQVFANNETIADAAWQEVSFDLSAIADNNPDFRLRFGLGPTDTYWQYSGWNIDDLALKGYYQGSSGNPACSFAPLELSATIYEEDTGKDTLHLINNGNAPLRIRFFSFESWISISDELIYIPPESSLDFAVTFNSAGVSIGEHSGTLEYFSNDRVTRSGSIPVLMTVEEMFVCGDTNGDKFINILDVVYLINSIYKGGPAPDPTEGADVNSDSVLSILDVVYLINSIYKGGPAPFCTH